MIAERTHADDGPASAEATETALTAAQAKVNLAPDALTFTITDDDARGGGHRPDHAGHRGVRCPERVG